MAGIAQGADGVDLHDVHGLGGGHHLAVAPAGVLHHGIAPLPGDALRRLLIVEGAHGLGGVPESGVLRGDHHLGDHGGYRLGDMAAGQLVVNGLLEMVADVALGHGAALGEGHVRLDGAALGGGGKAQVDHAHLGAVAVGDDHLVAVGNQVHDGAGGLGDQMELLGGGAAQGVAAQGDDDSFAHFNIVPLYAYRGIAGTLPLPLSRCF